MKKLGMCVTFIGMVFAYEMNPEIYRGTWSVVSESEDSKTVAVRGDTVIGLDQFNLAEGQSLIINHEDEGVVRFIIKKEETVINGQITSNCRLQLATTGFLLMDANANLVGKGIQLETGRGLSFAGDIQANEIEMSSKGLVLFTGSARGSTKLISNASVTIDGHIQSTAGKIAIKGKQLQIMGESKLDVSGDLGGTIHIDVDQFLHEDDAEILAIGPSGVIEIITLDDPELFGRIATCEAQGERGQVILRKRGEGGED